MTASYVLPNAQIVATHAARDKMALLAPLLIFVLTLTAPAVLGDGDTFWHLKAGEWILTHGVPHCDPFTFSMAGAPWSAHEWGSEVLLALAFRVAGWGGVIVLAALCAGGAALIIARRTASDLHGTATLVLTLICFSLLSASLLARPHVLALPALAAWSAGLIEARQQRRAPSWRLTPLMTLWVNLHGSFIFGLALIGPFALEAVFAARGRKRLGAACEWAWFALLALAAALINPQGFEALTFPFHLMGMTSLAGVAEWRAETFDHIGPLEIALLALLGLALTIPLRLPVFRLALLVALFHLALHHGRHQMLLALLAPLLLSSPIAAALPQARAQAGSRLSRRTIYAALAAVLALAGLRLATAPTRENGPIAPIAALNAVPASLREQRVFNEYGFGGFLIWSNVRPYIDGRTDLFGDRFMADYDRIVAPDVPALEAFLAREDIAWTIFPPSAPFVRAMNAEKGWRRLYADDYAVVHVRDANVAKR